MGQILLIVNPVAGKLRARSTLMDILEVYSAANLDVNVRLSQYRGHSRELARNAKADMYDRIVCIGGDGTLNEVISGVLESGENIPLGYIPLGSTNDFANSISLPKDPAAAAKLSIEGAPCQLDIGDFNTNRKFSYIASFGVFTSASYSAPQSVKNALGHFAYILEGVKSLQDIINLKCYSLHIEADDKVYDGDYMFGAIANSTSIGGILKLNSEMVDMSDGLFEMMLIRRINNISELNQVVLSLAKSDYKNKMFDFIHASSFKITANTEIKWSLDGEEAPGGTEVSISNLHNAITIYK
ncbi:MAG: diacylglycerol kinase family lipid kinase [Clostridia bacterium]|nr:diacylglycerol kinase family lipid kinase [Clostridia bacterium]